jgi:PAS domain S-box-containing protein
MKLSVVIGVSGRVDGLAKGWIVPLSPAQSTAGLCQNKHHVARGEIKIMTTAKTPVFDLLQVINASPVATFVIDTNHVVTHWNLALEELSGIPADEVVGTHHQWRAFYSAHRPVLADLVVDGLQGGLLNRYYGGKFRTSDLIPGAVEAEDYFPAMESGAAWLYFTASPLKDTDGKIVGAIETLQDVTEYKQEQIARRESERRLTDIVAGCPVAMFVVDANCRVTHWNHACEILTGMPAAEMVGRSDTWRAFYHFDNRRVVLAEMIVSGASEDEVRRHYDTRSHRAELVSGAYEAEDFFPNFGEGGKWLYFLAAPLRDRNGKVVGAIETLLDITDRKLAETALTAE